MCNPPKQCRLLLLTIHRLPSFAFFNVPAFPVKLRRGRNLKGEKNAEVVLRRRKTQMCVFLFFAKKETLKSSTAFQSHLNNDNRRERESEKLFTFFLCQRERERERVRKRGGTLDSHSLTCRCCFITIFQRKVKMLPRERESSPCKVFLLNIFGR